MGFKFTMGVDPYQDNSFQFDFVDISPPTIQTVERKPEKFDQQKYITISTVISDEGSKVISEVTLQYRRSGGEWENITMFNVEGDIYRGVLPRSKIGQDIEFRIVAVDGVGNQIIGEEETIEIGQEFLITGWILLVLLILIIAALVSVQIIGRLRTRGYLKNEFKGDRRTFSDFNKKGVM
jgi:hypothetical protein